DRAIAVDQRRAEETERDDDGAMLALDAKQRHEREDAAFAIIVDAHRNGHVFNRRHNNPTIKVQITSDSTPSVTDGSGAPLVRPRTVLRVWSGLVPISPKTTPNAERPSAERLAAFAGRPNDAPDPQS